MMAPTRHTLKPSGRVGAFVVAAGTVLALAVGSFGVEVPTAGDAASFLGAPLAQAEESDLDELRNPYSNDVQGYAILIQGDTFGIVEQNDGAGQTVFYLKDSVAETDEAFGALYTVFYYPGYDGNPSIDQFFEELMFNVKLEAGGSFRAISEGEYETIELAGVEMPASAWYRISPDSGYYLFEMRAMEVLPGGGMVVWSMSAPDEEVDVVLQGLSEAVATFKTDPMSYGGASVVQANASSLAERPASEADALGGDAPGSLLGGDAPGSLFGSGAPGSLLGGDAPGSLFGSGAGGDPSGTPASAPAPATATTGSITYTPTEFTDGHSFTMQIPKGWKVTYNGGTGLGALIDAYDPANPAVRLCFYGTQEIPASESTAAMYGGAFMMGDHTVAEYVSLLDEICAFANSVGEQGYPARLRLTTSEVLGSEPMTTITENLAQVGTDWMVSDEAVVIAQMTLDDGLGTPVVASVYAIVVPNSVGGTWSIDSVELISIVTAPPDMFADVSAALIESGCYGSFEVLGSGSGASSGGGTYTGGGAGFDSGYDPSAGILDSYYYQQQVQDNAMQAWDDYILGRDRYTLDDGSDLLVYYE